MSERGRDCVEAGWVNAPHWYGSPAGAGEEHGRIRHEYRVEQGRLCCPQGQQRSEIASTSSPSVSNELLSSGCRRNGEGACL